ncbi:alpha/beta fold hydrolase, partial [Rhizobium johnstonii]|uniref:alpha/beta fold hydrolase n=1 Tax=Rhizobium johnstonii TaxID=3019933 RepID=UPI003F9AC956
HDGSFFQAGSPDFSVRAASVTGRWAAAIRAAALGFMAERAGSKRTVVVDGASHVVMVSNPEKVAELIEEAAK